MYDELLYQGAGSKSLHRVQSTLQRFSQGQCWIQQVFVPAEAGLVVVRVASLLGISHLPQHPGPAASTWIADVDTPSSSPRTSSTNKTPEGRSATFRVKFFLFFEILHFFVFFFFLFLCFFLSSDFSFFDMSFIF